MFDPSLLRERLDAICMNLIAVGEAFKQIDRKTNIPAIPNSRERRESVGKLEPIPDKPE